MPTPAGASDVQSAAKRLSGLLQSEPQEPTENEQPESEQDTQKSQPETADNLQETPSENDADTAEETQKYKVKVDGEELEVSLEELQKGYMMEANYRNKTTALNKQRDAIEAKAAEVDRQLADAQLVIDEGYKSLESKEMQDLKAYDPDRFWKEYDKVQKKAEKFNALKERRTAELEAKQAKLIEKERELLFDAFPHWKDQATLSKESEQLFGVLKDIGFSDNELSSIHDHRMFLLAAKAQQLTTLQSEIDKAKKSVSEKAKTTKPKSSKPGIATTQERMPADKKALREQLRKSGKAKDAAKLLSM